VGASRLVNRNIVASRGRTSMRLEPEIWDALRDICTREQLRMEQLIGQIEGSGPQGGRTSAVRVHVVQYYRKLAELRI
jgi:predicted DNA-binding ribbon-helix-helix protein